LIKTEGFKKKFKQELPAIEFEVKQSGVNLRGTPDEVKKAKLFIWKKVTAAVQGSFDISESIGRVFAKDEAKSYLMDQLLNRGIISATWMCNDRSIVVYVLDEEDVKEAVDVLKNAVVERCLRLSELLLLDDWSQRWTDFVELLCLEEKLLDVHVSVDKSVLIVACVKTSSEKNRKRIENFLTNNNIHSYHLMLSHVYHWQ